MIGKLCGGGYGWDISLFFYTVLMAVFGTLNPLSLGNNGVEDIFTATVVLGIVCLVIAFKTRLVDN